MMIHNMIAIGLNIIAEKRHFTVRECMSTPSLDWALWRSFLAILREGSLSAAGRRLEVAHPTIRRHLDELEARLGSPLFVRSQSGLVATELAHSLRETALTMEAAAAQLVRIASADAGAVAGTVRITASELMGVEVLPHILSGLKALHPRLSFELTLTNSVENVLRHDADIAVRMVRPAQDGLLARKVALIPLGFYAHESWVLRQGEPASVSEIIASGSLIGYDREPALVRGWQPPVSRPRHRISASAPTVTWPSSRRCGRVLELASAKSRSPPATRSFDRFFPTLPSGWRLGW